MDLTMSIVVLGLLDKHVIEVHCYHSCFFLFDVQKLNKSLSYEGFKIPALVDVSVFHSVHMFVSDFAFVIFDNIERPLNATRIC
jgi:hypothetical protein